MCDNCKTVEQILKLLRLRTDIDDGDTREPVALAEKRLRCYYECVTADMDPGALSELEEDDDDWLPEY